MVFPDKEVRIQLISNGLYYFDAADRENIFLPLNKVSENRDGFAWREYVGPREARQSMHLLRFLSEQDSENMVRSDMIVNCPVTFEDVQ